MRVGYARVSSLDQNLAVQLAKLEHAACEKVYQEKLSGRTTARPQLQLCLDFVREGDIVVITRLDRLARSLLDLVTITEQLRSKHVQLQVLDQALDTSTPTGTLLFHMLCAVAEFENALRKERQTEGIAAAKRRGVRFGHKPQLTPGQGTQLRQARKDGLLIRQIMERFGLSRASVYRYLARPQEASADLAAD